MALLGALCGGIAGGALLTGTIRASRRAREAIAFGLRANVGNILQLFNYRADLFVLNAVVSQGEVAVIKGFGGLPTLDTSGVEFKFGSITWADLRGHSVRSPLAVRATPAQLAPFGFNPLIEAISTYVSGAQLAHVSARDVANYEDSGINWRIAEGYGHMIAAHGAGLRVRLGCAVTRIPAARSIASTAAWFGAHQLVGSFSKRCSKNAIFGQPMFSSRSRSCKVLSGVSSKTSCPGIVSVWKTISRFTFLVTMSSPSIG